LVIAEFFVIVLQGTCATCYQITDRNTNEIYAAKIISKASSVYCGRRDQVNGFAFYRCIKVLAYIDWHIERCTTP